ncbi:hypothetical protein QBC41DRAFT_321376 [Cercophora samala]|uniref:Uncharacterized protein n=1 Tax=Cercophora samala TaxID=330535 RepID=A0AA39ZD34_9PEZI|nr:hypothetical protein QBC41DRAFT_321376 [Cercophora samala]
MSSECSRPCSLAGTSLFRTVPAPVHQVLINFSLFFSLYVIHKLLTTRTCLSLSLSSLLCFLFSIFSIH